MSASNDYKFVTEWTVDGSLADVASVLKDVEAFPRWWRGVYLSARVLDPGAPDGVGRVAEFITRGFLPYVLRWRVRITGSREPHAFSFRTSGDLVGEGVWNLHSQGARVTLRLDWTVRAQKTIVRLLSFALRPIVSRNHAWAMARGREGLQAEIHDRRRPR